MAETKRVLVAGAGAIGSVFGGLLREAGHDVTLLGRQWHLQAVASAGLEIDGIWGEHHPRGFRIATSIQDLADRYDLLLVCVKAYDTQAIVSTVAPRLATDGVAISLQNGLGNVETLASAFGPCRSLGASVLVGANIPAPGRVTVTVQAAPVVVGPLDATDPFWMSVARSWVECLHAAGVSCDLTAEVLAALWAKVFYNAPLNPLGALLRVHYGALGEAEDLRVIMDRIIEEAFAVASARGVALPWSSAAEYRVLFYGQLLPSTYVHRSSMLQDLERGRRTEIDSINGRVWEYGATCGVPTPFNELMTRLVRWRSSHRDGPDIPPLHRR